MKNPLYKRLLRELKSEFVKYLVIFLLMTLTIGEISGFLVADESMIKAYNDSFTLYNVEDGNFALQTKADSALKQQLEALDITIYDLIYTDRILSNDSTLRIFQNREQVNLACVMEGRLASKPGEIAIDRMYADNNQLKVGDTISDGSNTWTITGLAALSDYSTMFESNSDSMFDAVKFGVAMVCPEEFSEFESNSLVYSYAWKYNDAPAGEKEEMERSQQLMKEINSLSPLKKFVPRYLNQAIQFTGEDMGSDRAMMTVLLYILIAILAFVFGITINSTIVKEANVIGTLRASGYTKRELIRHYMAMPLIVTLISALIGNIMGYTFFKNFNAGMYYGSYSLPTYVTIWSPQAFLETTLVPILLMLVITWLMLRRKLSLSPIKFLRRDLRSGRQHHAFRLKSSIPFFSRFRIRVFLQNSGSYLLMLVGILFANLLLMFGLIFPSILDHYQETITDNLLCNYQYLLEVPVELMAGDDSPETLLRMLAYVSQVQTDNEDAEEFSAYSLKTLSKGAYKGEEVLLYGIVDDSHYITLESDDNEVCISKAYADKFHLAKGDTITLKEQYDDKTYTFPIGGIYDYEGALAIFMPKSLLNHTFGLSDGYFSGYFSDTEITDIEEQYIATVIDLDALTKISRQLNVSMGGMMILVDAISVIMFLILIYLLAKIVIEKNAQAISMTKILGYENKEISRLYLLPTSIVVVTLLLLSLPLETAVMKYLFEMIVMTELSGWIPIYFDPMMYVKMILLGIGAYVVVAVLEYRRIRRVPMEEALKNVE